MSETSFLRLHGPIQLASATTACWKCRQSTVVHALIARDLEDFDREEDVDRVRVGESTFVYEVDGEALPTMVRLKLADLAPSYLPTFSNSTGETNWANRCEHCSALQGAFFQHMEPYGPFFGGPDDFHGALVLVSTEGFDVSSGSYSM